MKPQIVITDFNLSNRCGLDLLQRQREQCPDAKECLFVLITGNTSQSALAQAAEEDVYTYLLKPYTIDIFRKSIARAVEAKLTPSNYTRLINEGKELGLATETARTEATVRRGGV